MSEHQSPAAQRQPAEKQVYKKRHMRAHAHTCQLHAASEYCSHPPRPAGTVAPQCTSPGTLQKRSAQLPPRLRTPQIAATAWWTHVVTYAAPRIMHTNPSHTATHNPPTHTHICTLPMSQPA
eukprot:1139511-Pelagomonas_calceolata.AAC.3